MTTPESAGFEPDVNLQCDDPFGESRCTLTRDHAGDHVAYGGPRSRRSWPQMRLSDALDGPGFPDLGPGSELADAVLADARDRLVELEQAERLKTRRRFAKEIGAAHADPDWPGGS